jgi:hypothetical protein
MAGYTRQEVYADTDVIEATHTNNEFDQIVAAFNSSTGHKHDGTAAEGPLIVLISDSTQTDKVQIVTGGAKTTGTHQVTGLVTAGVGVTATTGDITATAGDVVLTAGDLIATAGNLIATVGDVVLTAGNVTLAALATVDGRDVSVDGTKLDGVETGATADQIASEVTSTPAGNLVATEVQAALNELDTEKAALAGAAFTGAVSCTDFTSNSIDLATSIGMIKNTVTGVGTFIDFDFDETTSDVTARFMRGTTNTGTRKTIWHTGDGTSGTAMSLDHGTGALVISGTVDGRDVATDGTKLDGIETAATADQTAAEVVFTATGNIIATDVQAAIAEVDTEKAALAGAIFTGAVTVPGFTSTGIVDSTTVSQRLVLFNTALRLGAAGNDYELTHVTNDQSIIFSGGDSGSNGGNIVAYGGTHATKAGDIEFRQEAIVEARFDNSASQWNFLANDIVTSGKVACGRIVTPEGSSLAISGGVIAVTNSWHRVDTEAAAASDDLDTINGFTNGMHLFLRAVSSANTVVLKDETGNLALAGDFSMDSGDDIIQLIYDGTSGKWKEVSRSDNGV